MAARSLATYNAKRDFAKTAEPQGKAGRAKGDSFVVQKHAATRLHYDFRLELDGVLLSWAVTRGPSNDPQEKRLAVRTEDHPLDYGSFEGTIPAGSYGGGTVMLWDHGRWEPEGDPREGLDKGKLHFTLHGERMKGEWVLVRLHPRPGEKRENWLLRKVEDTHSGGKDALTDTHVASVASGRAMADIAAGDLAWTGGKARKAKAAPAKAVPPAFRPLQLATLADHVPPGSAWVHELKFDGYRCLLVKSGDDVIGWSRNGLDWSPKFAPIVAAAKRSKAQSFAIDGEVVAIGANGMTSFSELQAALSGESRTPLGFYAFDLLELDGTDLTGLPLVDRKRELEPLIADIGAPLAYSEHSKGDGERTLELICKSGGEGIISKRADSKYAGKRSTNWLKIKCTRRQEFVIAGWSKSDRRAGFASLILTVRDGDAWTYAGRVGTGFDTQMIDDLSARMKPLQTDKPPFHPVPAEARKGATWIRPELVAEIAFTEMTPTGVLRHPSFIGLREDKPANKVVPEVPIHVEPAKRAASKSTIVITSGDRVVFPEVGLTKQQLADYYETIWPIMEPHLANRPVSLVRCPQGRGKFCFFQKHDSGGMPEAVKDVPITEKDGSVEQYLYIDTLDGLIGAVQMGALEFHGWGSRIADVEKPDRLVIDLDPDEGLGFEAVKAAAIDVRKRLKAAGLESWPMVTGGKGLHIVAPLDASAEWPEVKAFAKAFAERLAADEPDRFTSKMSKAGRAGKIFVDWLRNQRGATAVIPYSTRARERAPVAAPVAWSELETLASGNAFTTADATALLKRAKSKALADWGTGRQTLPSLV